MKKYFKIQLFEDANSTCEQIALMAAKNNGGETNFSLEHLNQMALFMKADPINTALADNRLYIDVKIGEAYKPGCVIEEVEIFELEMSEQNGLGALAE